MTSDRRQDPAAFHALPWLIAGSTETLVGVIAIAIILTAALAHPGDNAAHEALLYLSGLLVVAGFITIAATLVTTVNARGHEATLRRIDQATGPNGHMSKQLVAARTVDLMEVQDRMEGVARNLTVNAIADLEKSSAAQYGALSQEVIELGRQVDNMLAEITKQNEARDAAWLKDVAAGVELGRTLERDRPDDFPNT